MTAKRLTRTKAGKAFRSLATPALVAAALQSLVFSDASFTAGGADPALQGASMTLPLRFMGVSQ